MQLPCHAMPRHWSSILRKIEQCYHFTDWIWWWCELGLYGLLNCNGYSSQWGFKWGFQKSRHYTPWKQCLSRHVWFPRYTPLRHAANEGHEEIVAALLKHWASVNITDNFCEMALKDAARNGYEEIVGILLSYNADVNVQNYYGY